jgi:hypothetical protein
MSAGPSGKPGSRPSGKVQRNLNWVTVRIGRDITAISESDAPVKRGLVERIIYAALTGDLAPSRRRPFERPAETSSRGWSFKRLSGKSLTR